MKAISLFSGIGGLDIGFSSAGFDIIAQVEIDTFCQRILKRHAHEWWPDATVFTDVRDFGLSSLPGIEPGDIDVIFGGFPCQDISAAGNGAGIRSGKQSGLWYEFARIIGEFQPRTVLLENVSRIVSPRKEDGEIQPADALLVISALSEMGYGCRWGIISAADTGAPHLRERWFCVADHHGKRELQPQGSNRNIRRRAAHQCHILGNAQITRPSQPRSIKTKNCRQNRRTPTRSTILRPKRSSHNVRRHRRLTAQPRLVRATHGIPAWLDKPRWPAGQGTYQHDYEQPRTIGKGIDKNRSSRIKALGNAVLPQIAYPLACVIKQLLESEITCQTKSYI